MSRSALCRARAYAAKSFRDRFSVWHTPATPDGAPDPAAMPVKPGVMIYHSILPQLERLSDCERGQLFLAVMQYSIRGRYDPIDFAPDLVLQGLIPLIDRDRVKYLTVVAARRRAARIKWERAEAEKGGSV